MQEVQKDQSKVLLITCFTEFGERYSYYIIQSLLIFFLIEKFHISQASSATLVGTVLGLVYISAIVGGYVADKLIGYYRAAFIGSLLSLVGLIILSISNNQDMLFLGLTFISISTGLIKSNISSFLGSFYDKAKVSQSHRDFGFSIYLYRY